ncbi:MAG: hypothetical protein A2W31_08630 [Planctomycetes bacterium RBG_16_64_10]|nr:MAG: hypothetical protein A2W31_08630 [Planctomycetes bacterium RBG_16_64_10]
MNAHANRNRSTSRREFLRYSGGGLAGAALASRLAARSYAGEQNTIEIALIGCGGRGTGAAVNALSTQGPTRLVAMADVFQNRLDTSLQNLAKQFGKQVVVPAERCLVGLDAFRKAIDALPPGGVAILATPPAFRPIHLEYAVEKGCHVFMEKSFAVDAPGVRRVLKAGERAAAKNLKIAGGLMSRHNIPLQHAVEQIHGGLIGEVITCWAYREHGPVGFTAQSTTDSDMAHQIRNYSCFTWVNGSFILDWLIHNIDVCCWVKNAWPVSAQGQGGRQQRREPDQLFDHYAVEYTFDDGTRLFAQGRHMTNCWGFFGDVIHGAKGSAVLGEGIPQPRIFRGHKQTPENLIWEYKQPSISAYQVEHNILFEAIRQDKPHNETERCAKATLAGILGRMAAESGQEVTWNDAMQSNLELFPGLDAVTSLDTPTPVRPDQQGQYPVAIPGFAQVL